MTFDDLIGFIEHRMSMSHIYQPLLIQTLVNVGGTATVRQLALEFLSEDESQLQYYEDRIKKMPVVVLKRHGVLEEQRGVVSLTTPKLNFVQRARVRMLCEQKMQEFLVKRGLGLWDYRLTETDPVPGDVRYRVLAAARGRCALCGATRDERPLDIDHIIPRKHQGKNAEANLQVLCSKCNRSKGARDNTDFRMLAPDRDPSCVFCAPALEPIATHGTVMALPDRYPVTAGHTLVIPVRHTDDFFSMTGQERRDAEDLLRVLRNQLLADDSTITGFNVGANCGITAGQTVAHAHLHLIPRRPGDTSDPRGGIRGAIPERRTYAAS